MSKISWFSLIAGAGIGAACAMTLAKRKEANWKLTNNSSSLQSLSMDFLQEVENNPKLF